MSGVRACSTWPAMMGLWRPMADYHAVNVTGTENVCRAALAEGVAGSCTSARGRSTAWIWATRPRGLPAEPFREPYAITKAAATWWCSG